MSNQIPSLDQWLKEAKADAAASKVGMFLCHNGIVRETPKSVVREGDDTKELVQGMFFDYDQDKVDAAIAKTLAEPGIEFARVWMARGELQVGDDIMYVMIGGDIRPRVIDALQNLVGEIKTNCVTEIEKRA